MSATVEPATIEDQAIETAWHIFQRERDKEPTTILRQTFRHLVAEMASQEPPHWLRDMPITPTTDITEPIQSSPTIPV